MLLVSRPRLLLGGELGGRWGARELAVLRRHLRLVVRPSGLRRVRVLARLGAHQPKMSMLRDLLAEPEGTRKTNWSPCLIAWRGFARA